MFTVGVVSRIIILLIWVNLGFSKSLYRSNSPTIKDVNNTEFPACQVFCHGPLLHTVQMAQLYNDSKTFVDMKLKYSPDIIISDFEQFMIGSSFNPTKDQIQRFVDGHFDEVGKEFAAFVPTDWKEAPSFLNVIEPKYKNWAKDLHHIWKELGRKMIDDVFNNPDFYSIIPVKNPVIVPGGRFREFYYWDSYWIIRGLLHSEMYDTARGMIENFLSIVERFGFIPNGGRIYYANRSQPPLLAPMILSYLNFTQDKDFAKNSVHLLEREFEYWMNYHLIQVNGHNVFTYGGNDSLPRPESYREDVELASELPTEEERAEMFSELKAAAESGMDFSSRWYIDAQGGVEGNLAMTKTRFIVPVELNAILYWNARIIAHIHMMNNNYTKVNEYEAIAADIFEAVQAIHWSEEVGAWLDYDLINMRQRNFFVPTNLAPLWTGAFNLNDSEHISAKVLNYIDQLELDKYPGGVPNSLFRTGEQWDFPNVWPPMQDILIEGLYNLGTSAARNLSDSWARRWIESNYEAYRQSNAMFEKYDAERFGGYGGGGEYVIQRGFGWTNGVILDLLVKYGDHDNNFAVIGKDFCLVTIILGTLISLSTWLLF